MKKRIFSILLMVMMICVFPTSTKASDTNNSNPGVEYVVYDQDGNIVEKGVLQQSDNKRYSWSTNITLSNGSTVVFKKDDKKAFLASKGASLRFSYTLNKSATVQYNYMKCSSATSKGSVWSKGTVTGKSGIVSKKADEATYYYVKVTNMSSDTIKITKASLDF